MKQEVKRIEHYVPADSTAMSAAEMNGMQLSDKHTRLTPAQLEHMAEVYGSHGHGGGDPLAGVEVSVD